MKGVSSAMMLMFMLLHRYKFESNSQLYVDAALRGQGCLCYYIDTSLKAIHNHHNDYAWVKVDVYAIT